MAGLMADNDIQGQFEIIGFALNSEEWSEIWDATGFEIETFETLGINHDATDRALWQMCQQREIVLVTGNRNKRGHDSLENTLRQLGTPDSLPVFTISNPGRIANDNDYLQKVVARLLEYLFDIEDLRGTGRLFLP